MAETILLDIAAKVLSSLGSNALHQVGLAWGVKKDLTKMASKVSTIKDVLLDAEEQQRSSRAVKAWLQKLQLILYDADDLLDEFATETKRREVEKSLVRKVRYFFTSSNPLVFRYVVGREIEGIMKRLDGIVLEMRDFEFVVKLVERPIETIRKEESHSYVETGTIIGRDKDRDILVDLLLSHDEKENLILPIVGMGGLGKTTLAQMVYGDQRIQNRFTKRLWVCISNDFDIEAILVKILQADGQGGNNEVLEQLQNRVRELLTVHKCILFLDDVWNENVKKWEELEHLLTRARGSRIVVTTRSKDVASIVKTCTVEPYELRGLSDKDCLDVLLKCAFKNRDESKHPNLVKIGEKIVKKCGGVPLAARTLGSILFLKREERDWLSVKDSEMWALVQEENDILPILRLSYDQMPSHLKRCFAYCSLFEKDAIINGRRLIYAWMAQGFVQCLDTHEELEDISEGYILELVRRSFLEPCDESVYYDEGEGGDVYKMHDLVHDLAQYVARNECLTIKGDLIEAIPDTVRHVSFDLPRNFDFLRHLFDAKKSRTILNRGRRPFNAKEFRCLRVLEDFPYPYIFSGKMGKLKLLRYLRLGALGALVPGGHIPKSLWELLNLQYLEIHLDPSEDCELRFEKLINLRCLFLSIYTFRWPGKKFKIDGLTSLRTLILCANTLQCLHAIANLPRLRELVLMRCSSLSGLPANFGHLTSLESLKFIECNQAECLVDDDFKGLRSLKKLKFSDVLGLVSLPKGLLLAAATVLTHLEIEGCGDFTLQSDSVLPNLLSLQSLRLRGCPKSSSLPEGMQCLTNLQYLNISECEVFDTSRYRKGGEDWPMIAHVPNIEIA